MTQNELSWVKAQPWWNDLFRVYTSTTIYQSMDLVQFLEIQSLEKFAIYMIKDTRVDYLECQTLAKIANACIDHVDHADHRDYQAPVIRKFQYSKKENLVATLHSDHILLQKELEKVLAQMSEKGLVYDRLVNDGGQDFEFYRSSYELVEL